MELQTTEAFILAIGSLGLGLVLLIRGGNWTIDSAIYIANRLGVSPLLVGFTIVAFGTSLPELIVSVNANFAGSPGIAVGNVLGSNIANILLVIGATAVVAPLVVVPNRVARDLIMMMAATLLLTGLMLYGEINRLVGFGMILLLVLFTMWQYFMALKGEIPVEDVEEPAFKTLKASLAFLGFGLLFIALGAEFLVRGAKVSALIIGVPEAVIALSVIAIGTSLPELSTCLIAARKKQTDIIIGNIVGSNAYNIMLIIGVTAATKPIVMADLAPQLVDLDIWLVLGISTIFTALLLFFRKISKGVGLLFLAAYAVYILAIYGLYLT